MQTESTDPGEDPYARLMFPFLRSASEELSQLSEQVKQTECLYISVLHFYGEAHDIRPQGAPVHHFKRTEDFFGIFREFAASYRKAQQDNAVLSEQRQQEAKRRSQVRQRERQRQLTRQQQGPASRDEDQLLEKLLNNLRQKGGSANRHRRRARGCAPAVTANNQNLSAVLANDLQGTTGVSSCSSACLSQPLEASTNQAPARSSPHSLLEKSGSPPPLSRGEHLPDGSNRQSTSTLAATLMAQLHREGRLH